MKPIAPPCSEVKLHTGGQVERSPEPWDFESGVERGFVLNKPTFLGRVTKMT